MRTGLLIVVCMLCPLLMCHETGATSSQFEEYQVKAAFIYNFIKFNRWPDSAFQESGDAPLLLCVVGADPFGAALEPIQQKKAQQRSIVVNYLPADAELAQLRNCQVMFISGGDPEGIKHLLERVRGYPVLTISDSSGFARSGGCIELGVYASSIGFILNKSAISRQQLEMSYKVYALALDVVEE